VKVVLRYHEIALKGRNRPFFVERLAQNAKRLTADMGGRVFTLDGRLRLELPDSVAWEQVERRLSDLFGVANFSRAFESALDMEALKRDVLAALSTRRFGSFRVTSKRSYKAFPLTSPEIDRELGAAVHLGLGTRVDLEHPELGQRAHRLAQRVA